MGAKRLFLNGCVITGDTGFTLAEALLIDGNRIVLTGTAADCRAAAGAGAEIVDLQGGCVLPGFIDCHSHLLDYGDSLESVDLLDTRSFEQIVARVAEKVRTTPRGEWIYGRGWNPTMWDDPAYPDHAALSAISPDNPVVLGRSDGHAAIANAAAMAAAGIDATTPDPADGQILRRADGSPTGTFVEGALMLVKSHIPPLTPAQRRRMMRTAACKLHGFGVTGIHDAIEKAEYIDDFLTLAAEGALGLRVAGMLLDTGEADLAAHLARFAGIDDPTGFFTLRCFRLLADGGLGAQGAALFEPYADRPDHAGFLMIGRERIEQAAEAALAIGWHLCTHAIGDRAVAYVLDAYEAVLARHPGRDHRFKLEHASLIGDGDFARIGRLGVIPSVQPAHVVADLPWIEKRLGNERIGRVFAFRRMLDQGAILAMGSDFPVESADPLWGFYCGLTRATADGLPSGGWMPGEKLDRAALVHGYGHRAALAGFQEQMIGTLAPGKRADLAVIDRDILTVEPEALLSARVTHTFVDGELVAGG